MAALLVLAGDVVSFLCFCFGSRMAFFKEKDTKRGGSPLDEAFVSRPYLQRAFLISFFSAHLDFFRRRGFRRANATTDDHIGPCGRASSEELLLNGWKWEREVELFGNGATIRPTSVVC